MNARQADILMRRKALRVRVAAQRLQVAQALQPWTPVLRVADTAWAAGRFMRAHPVMTALAVGVVAARRRNLEWLAEAALRFWDAYRLFVSRHAGFRQ